MFLLNSSSDKPWMLHGIIALGSGYIIAIICAVCFICTRCIQFLKFRHRQFRNQREIERNPEPIQLRLLPQSVQCLS